MSEEFLSMGIVTFAAVALTVSFNVELGAANVPQESTVKSIPTVTFAPMVDYAVNGVSEIQAVAGVVVNGESRMRHVEETRALNLPAIRLYIWFGVDWWQARLKEKSLVSTGADLRGKELVKEWCELDFDKLVKDQLDATLRTDPKTGLRNPADPSGEYCSQFWQLEQLEAWKARKNVILHLTQPHPRGPEDFAAYGRYYRACVREIKRRFPDLDVRYVMISNEPDYEYPRAWDDRNIEQSVRMFYDFFKELQADIHKEFPEVTLLGPGISQFMTWDKWKYWTVSFLEQAPEARYFNDQSYASRIEYQLAWTAMLQSASLRIKGRLTPVVISETCCIPFPPAKDYSAHEWHIERHLLESDTFFRMMEHPDQFAIKTYFYYHYLGDWVDVWHKSADGTMTPTPLYWLFWILRDLRGTRVYCDIDHEEAKTVRSIAARNGDDLVVALFNSGKTARAVKLQAIWPQGMMAPSIVAESLKYDPLKKKFVVNTTPYPRIPDRLTLAPGEVKKLRWTLSPAKMPKPTRVEEREFYASGEAFEVRKETVTQTIKAGSVSPSMYTLFRAAFYVDDPLAIDRLRWKINGHAFSRPFVLAAGERPILYVEMAIPNEWADGKTILEFQPVADAVYRVMFASLVRRPIVEGAPKFERAAGDDSVPAELTLGLPSTVTAGTAELSITLANSGEKALNGALSLQLPEGWTAGTIPATLETPAHGTVNEKVVLTIPDGQLRGDRLITATLTPRDAPPVIARRGASLQPLLVADHAGTPPSIDGDLKEWNGHWIVMRHDGPDIPTPYTSRAAFKWDANAFYCALEIKGRALMPVPEGQAPWLMDVYELFFDYLNSKATIRTEQFMQAIAVAKDLKKGGPNCWTGGNDPYGSHMANQYPDSFKVAVRETKDGFILEGAFDWKALTDNRWVPVSARFRPKAGQTVGFEAALANRSIVGGVGKPYSDPSKWGVLRLDKPGESMSVVTEITQVPVKSSVDDAVSAESGKAAEAPLGIIFDENSTDDDDWIMPQGLNFRPDGSFALPNKGGGTTIMLKHPVEGLLSEAGMNLTVTLTGFELEIPDAGAVGKTLATSARVFFTPASPTGYVEPYIMKDVLCVYVFYNQLKPTEIALYSKRQEGDGMGKRLWAGNLENGQFPVRITLTLDARNYRIALDKPVTTVDGVIAGPHGLDAETWKGPAWFGFKAVTGEPGYALIKRVALTPGKKK